MKDGQLRDHRCLCYDLCFKERSSLSVRPSLMILFYFTNVYIRVSLKLTTIFDITF